MPVKGGKSPDLGELNICSHPAGSSQVASLLPFWVQLQVLSNANEGPSSLLQPLPIPHSLTELACLIKPVFLLAAPASQVRMLPSQLSMSLKYSTFPRAQVSKWLGPFKTENR